MEAKLELRGTRRQVGPRRRNVKVSRCQEASAKGPSEIWCAAVEWGCGTKEENTERFPEPHFYVMLGGVFQTLLHAPRMFATQIGASIARRKSAEPWRGSRRVLQSESGWTQPALGWARGSRPKAQAAMGKPGFWIPMPCAHLEDTSARSACSAGLIRLDRLTEFSKYAGRTGRISLELAIGPSPFQLGTCTVRSPW